ncbi:cytochrome c/FTR1 family iron permease [Nitrosococcus wardiae]|uniref:C-type cytochrome n=1 Tax=Nitrosococcus wardiae TaxID=1814290 RepID=A0A4P7C2Z4_9GAMM|nr:cytochrome c/FTR1 family iron permease [Nitrosococcus wardiae]QBQ55212.1 c-type cytochrome [Nitrosococcus wardiae]
MGLTIPSLRKWLGGLALLIGLMGYGGVGSAEVAAGRAQTALHMLDYISVDYPEFIQDGQVLNVEEYQEQLEFAHEVLGIVEQLPTTPQKSEIAEQAHQLLALIQNKAPGERVATAANELRWEIIRIYQIEIAPQQAPNLEAGEALYQARCATCHGVEGYGDGPAAQGLEPEPTNFHNQARQEQRSIYSLFSTITLGVPGTAMPSFQQPLSEQQRWALAFYVSTFATASEERKAGAALWQQGLGKEIFPDLQALTSQTPREVSAQHGEEARQVLAYLRSEPALLRPQESPLNLSLKRLEQSLEAYREGDNERAQQLAVEAYLEGFELVEASLNTLDSTLRTHIEREMMAYRALLREGAPIAALQAEQKALQELLGQAQKRLEETQLSPTAIALSALAIILREGLEAVLIVGAIISLLIRSGRRDALMYVHLGWIPALVLGVATWFAATYFISISGASRELTEGIAALVAAIILLYVGFWLHGKAYAKGWRAFIAKQVRGVLNKRTLWALALLSFLAVYREVFETVLFYQALWAQAGSEGQGAVLGGFGVGVVVLLIVSGLIFYYSVRLPIKLFFGVTSGLLALLAVILTGKGVGALQEAGMIPVHPVAFPSLPALGVYPNWQVLLLQGILLVAVVVGFAYTHITSRRLPAADNA